MKHVFDDGFSIDYRSYETGAVLGHWYYFRRSKILFKPIPKVYNTSLLCMLVDIEIAHGSSDVIPFVNSNPTPGEIGRFQYSLTQYRLRSSQSLREAREHAKHIFICLRDPIERLHSALHDKLYRNIFREPVPSGSIRNQKFDFVSWTILLQVYRKKFWLFTPDEKGHLPPVPEQENLMSITFDEIIEYYVKDILPIQLDWHIAPQYLFLDPWLCPEHLSSLSILSSLAGDYGIQERHLNPSSVASGSSKFIDNAIKKKLLPKASFVRTVKNTRSLRRRLSSDSSLRSDILRPDIQLLSELSS